MRNCCNRCRRDRRSFRVLLPNTGLNRCGISGNHGRLRSAAPSPASTTTPPPRTALTRSGRLGFFRRACLGRNPLGLTTLARASRFHFKRLRCRLNFFLSLRRRCHWSLLLGFEVGRLQWRRLARGRLVAFLAPLQSVFHPFAHKGLVTYGRASGQFRARHVVGRWSSVVGPWNWFCPVPGTESFLFQRFS